MLRSIKVTTAIADEDILKNVDVQKKNLRAAFYNGREIFTTSQQGNSEKVFSFPVSYDADKKPMCQCNSTADGMSSNNSSAVIYSDSNSMVVRTCGVESTVTFFAQGWATKK